MLEAMAGDARERECLYQHDTGLAHVRRFLAKEAERQAAALAEARGPGGTGSERVPDGEARPVGSGELPGRRARLTEGRNGELEHNPWLAAPRGNKGDAGTVEDFGDPLLIRWQTRARPPSEHEGRLADALAAIFGDGVFDLPGIADRLNAAGVASHGGGPWTADAFAAAMRTLASP